MMRNKWIFLTGLLQLQAAIAFSQCPELAALKVRFNDIYGSTTKTSAQRLTGLLRLKTAMQECRYEKDSLNCIILQKIGLLYFLQADFNQAVSYTEMSIRVARDPLPGHAVYDSAIVQSYFNLGIYYDSLKQEERSNEVLDSCVISAISSNSAYDFAIEALQTRTDKLFNKGDYSLCTAIALLGEALIERYYHASDSIAFINHFVSTRINALYFSDKRDLLDSLLAEKEREFIAIGKTDYLAAVYGIQAQLYRDQGDYDTAIVYLRKALVANTHLKYQPGVCEDLAALGRLYAKNLHRYGEAIVYCQAALKQSNNAGDSLVALRDMAAICAQQGRFDKAQDLFRRAFGTLGKGMTEDSLIHADPIFEGFNVFQDILDLVTARGAAYLQQYTASKDRRCLDSAISVFRKGDLFLTRLKRDHALQFASNLVWRLSAHNLYEQAVEACYAKNDPDNAFYFFERSRAVLLTDQINERHLLRAADMARASQLDQEMSRLDMRLQAMAKTSRQYLETLEDLYGKAIKREALTRELSRKTLAGDDTANDYISVAKARREVLKDRTLLEIFTGDSSVYLLKIAPDAQSLWKVDRGSYDSLSRAFMLAVSHPVRYEKDFSAWLIAARRLYSVIFSGHLPSPGSVIISPDAAFFPFEALVTEDTGTKPTFFIERYATSYTYSLRYLATKQSSEPGTDGILGVAPVTFDPSLHLPALPGSDRSLERILAKIDNGYTLIDRQATKAAFLQHFSRYSIVQLYTHAAGTSIQNDPVIYFADSALYLSQLELPQTPVTRLVVLSACETADGSLHQGEGIFSFNRSFAALGVPAAVSNLWAVDDQSTYALTEGFYKYLAQGLPGDLALQKAKLEFVRTASTAGQFPYYWAGTILVGKSDPIVVRHRFPVYWLLLAVALSSGLVYLVYLVYRARIKNPVPH